jgi:hypothetical protein
MRVVTSALQVAEHILTDWPIEERETNAPADEALQLQRPLPDNELIVLPQPMKEKEEPVQQTPPL